MSSPCREPTNAASAVQLSPPHSASASDSSRSTSSVVVGGGQGSGGDHDDGGIVATTAGSHAPTTEQQQQQKKQSPVPEVELHTSTQRPVNVVPGEEQHAVHPELPPQPLHSASHVPPHSAPGETDGEDNGHEPVGVSVDDKKNRATAAAQRPNGPSLLTQALASARGIPAQSSSQAQGPISEQININATTTTNTSSGIGSGSGSGSSSTSSGGRSEKLPLDTTSATAQHARANVPRSSFIIADKQQQQQQHDLTTRHGDNNSIEPRPRQPSPTSSTMAARTMTSTPVAVPGRDAASVPASFDPSAFTDVRDMLLDQRNDADQALQKTSTSLDMDRKISAFERTRACSYSTSPETSTTPTNTTYFDSTATSTASHPFDDTTKDPRLRNRPGPPDHRYTLGPEKTEKIWSIGSGEGTEEGGLVEKSVAEAMAGKEHNARSRKASYSLRFFKEGLPPDDNLRRRDTKTGGREKLSATTEEGLQQPSKPPAEHERVAQTHDASGETSALYLDSAQSPLRTSPPSIREAEADYFNLSKNDATNQMTLQPGTPPLEHSPGHEASKPSVLQPSQPQVGPTPAWIPATEPKILEGRRRSGDSTEVGESQEDVEGDESGEEKISSAVFLPHQELSEARAHGRDASSIVGGPGQRPRSLSKDEAHPWLVKADEPEPEIDDEEEGKAGRLSRYRSRESLVSSRGDLVSDMTDDLAVEGEYEINNQLAQALARTGVQHIEDQLHDSQQHIRQPLEAIELIPYKHQVGGHTTLWRFSRRAVCKQLNNRENEFYETIERYHRELLPFLPRYIGVLNVTFQKQLRRKSTSKKDDGAAAERKKIKEAVLEEASKPSQGTLEVEKRPERPTRVVSHSMASSTNFQIPTVTFHNNRHILPRNLLQPTPSAETIRRRSIPTARASSASAVANSNPRPPMDDRPNSWGATTVNKRLRNEVFNDAFLKEPVEVYKHRPPHQRSIPRPTLQRLLRSSNSDSNLVNGMNNVQQSQNSESARETSKPPSLHGYTQSDLGPVVNFPRPESRDKSSEAKDLSGTSAPEPETLTSSPVATRKKKRRYSAGGLRRKPSDVQESRGDLKYFEQADDVGYKGDNEAFSWSELQRANQEAGHVVAMTNGATAHVDAPEENTAVDDEPAAPEDVPQDATLGMVPRPINPKEAKAQRDRVEYFLLLEDLTAGMKRPCMMDLKMGTRQYGADATAKKQKSQKEKCRTTTSAELGVRICGLQVWNAKTEAYDFQDKYFGRGLKAGAEFQAALQKFLYDGVELQSILRHIPVVLRKLARLEQIVQGLHGYRFYAASLLMFYDGDNSEDSNDYDTAYESLTDVATDTEEVARKKRKNKREIDFKMADFANSLTPLDRIKDQRCPPTHPDAPDVGFLKGLRSLRKYFLQIQRDVRAELDLGYWVKHNGAESIEDEIDEGMLSL